MSVAACGICQAHPYKYKCPTCQLPYCSVQCYRSHKPVHSDETRTSRPQSSDQQANDALPQPKAPQNPLAALSTHPDLIEVFQLHPSLTPVLEDLYKATLPPEQGGTIIPKLAQDSQREKPWKQDFADRIALRRLQNIRESDGSHGEAMTDFVAVVRDIVEKAYQQPGGEPLGPVG